MVMEHDQLDPQIEKLLKDVKLKEPKQQEMTDYLSQVRSKITIKQRKVKYTKFGRILVPSPPLPTTHHHSPL